MFYLPSPFGYLLLLLNSVLNKFSWIIEKKNDGWISFSIELDCLNDSFCLYACIYKIYKYTLGKICVHCIHTINLNQKNISLVVSIQIFSLDSSLFIWSTPAQRCFESLLWLLLLLLSCHFKWMIEIIRECEKKRERENGNCTKDGYEFS